MSVFILSMIVFAFLCWTFGFSWLLGIFFAVGMLMGSFAK